MDALLEDVRRRAQGTIVPDGGRIGHDGRVILPDGGVITTRVALMDSGAPRSADYLAGAADATALAADACMPSVLRPGDGVVADAAVAKAADDAWRGSRGSSNAWRDAARQKETPTAPERMAEAPPLADAADAAWRAQGDDLNAWRNK